MGINCLYLSEEYFVGQGDFQLSVDVMRVFRNIVNDGLAQWARNYSRMVLFNYNNLRCVDVDVCVNYCWFVLGRAVLS